MENKMLCVLEKDFTIDSNDLKILPFKCARRLVKKLIVITELASGDCGVECIKYYDNGKYYIDCNIWSSNLNHIKDIFLNDNYVVICES